MTQAALDIPGVRLASDDLIALRRVALSARAIPGLAALPGGIATRRRGHGLVVADMREYVSGDDIRHLDRGTTARTGRLHVRQFHAERDRVTLLVADFRPSMFWGLRRAFRSVAAAEALALIGWQLVESGGRVGLLAIGRTAPVVVPPRGRAKGMLGVIGAMVEAHRDALLGIAASREDDPPLEQGLVRCERLTPSGAEIVIASGFDQPGATFADRLDALARRRFPRLIAIADGQAERLPRGRYALRLADGRRVRVSIRGAGAQAQTEQIAGRDALVLDAGDTVETTARRIAASFPVERRP